MIRILLPLCRRQHGQPPYTCFWRLNPKPQTLPAHVSGACSLPAHVSHFSTFSQLFQPHNGDATSAHDMRCNPMQLSSPRIRDMRCNPMHISSPRILIMIPPSPTSPHPRSSCSCSRSCSCSSAPVTGRARHRSLLHQGSVHLLRQHLTRRESTALAKPCHPRAHACRHDREEKGSEETREGECEGAREGKVSIQ